MDAIVSAQTHWENSIPAMDSISGIDTAIGGWLNISNEHRQDQ
jgi:hypothetical protein